jgi:hypothetical protein
MHTFRYRLLGSSWGIAIDLDAEATVLPSPPTGVTTITRRLSLCVSLKTPDVGHLIPLTAEERDWLAHGLRLIAAEIETACPTGYVLVTVYRAAFNECDYQPEGLAAALAGWAAAEFGLTSTLPAARYSRDIDQYVYDWM